MTAKEISKSELTVTVYEEIQKIVSQVKQANEDYEIHGKEIEKFKKDKVIEAGKIYETRDPKFNKNKHLICAQLKRDFLGQIDEGYIENICPEIWKQSEKSKAGRAAHFGGQNNMMTAKQALKAECMKLKTEDPNLLHSEIKQKAMSNLSDRFSKNTLRTKFPDWIKNDGGIIPEDVIVSAPVSEEQARFTRKQERNWESLRFLIGHLCGLESYEEQRQIASTNRELVEKTKSHRLKIAKQENDMDLRETHGLSQRLYYLLGDFLKILDDEVDVRKAKSGIGSV